MRQKKFWNERYDRLLARLWPQKEKTVEAIASEMGFSERSIQTAVDRLGLPRRTVGRRAGSISNLERDEAIRREAGAGVSEGTIMNKYGLSSRRIKQILQSNGKKEQG